MGLLLDDREWTAVFASGRRLRSLFTFILQLCAVGDPLKLWEEFKEHLCDDLPTPSPDSDPTAPTSPSPTGYDINNFNDRTTVAVEVTFLAYNMDGREPGFYDAIRCGCQRLPVLSTLHPD